MFKLLKNIIKTEPHAPLVIRFDEIPPWLDKRGKEVFEVLSKNTVSPMKVIREVVKNLEQIVQTLRAAQFDAEIHPKLKSIAKNALPQFAKAMETALSKPLPEDIEGFYTTAAEILKGCLNSTRGQGKYLQTVFPEDMRSVRIGIDAIGREINAMTEALAPFRREMANITEARKTYGALVDIEKDTEKSREKEIRIHQRIQAIRDRVGACELELRALERDEAVHALNNHRRTLQSMTEERDRTIRRYTVLSMTASHVLRKAEKLTHKRHKSTDERTLRHAMVLLSDHAVPDSGDIAQALTAACPIAKRMIDEGDINLKNKEERALFTAPEQFIGEITTICTMFIDQTQQCDAAEHALHSHPIVARSEELIREKSQLEMMCAREEQSCSDIIKWHDELQKNIPSLREKLQKMVGEISGNDVQVQYSQVFTPSQGG
ncbi:MAG: hypothetical protein NTY71_04595 [Methanoregula sp.]|nr:hypothetical protein [Methanoregula sp.]